MRVNEGLTGRAAARYPVKMTRYLFVAIFIAVAATASAHAPEYEYDYKSGWPMVCAHPGQALLFDVSTAGRHENGVIILKVDEGVDLGVIDSATPDAVATFNSHYDGGYWEQKSGGEHLTGVHSQETCYLIVSRHKRTGPDRGEPWISSHFRIKESNVVGFADFADRTYVNAIVTVSLGAR